MTTNATNFDATKVTIGEPREVKSTWGNSKYFPILYGGDKLRVLTPKCFCFGLQRDKLSSGSYKLPLVMANEDRVMTEEHKQFVSLFKSMMVAVKKGMNVSTSPQDIGKCLRTTKNREAPTLYPKVRYDKAKKKFYTGFYKPGKVCIDKPASVEGDRCLARAVLVFDSVYVGGGHVKAQVMVHEAILNFDVIKDVFFLPDDETESSLDPATLPLPEVSEDEW